MIITRKQLQDFFSPRLRGLGIWNAYFLFKFGLFYLSYISFDLPPNFIMALLLCIHLGRRRWHLIWRLILGTAALILLYHDSYLPGLSQIMAQKNNLQEFSFNYVLNFLWDFVSLPMIFSFCGVLLATFFLRAYIRVTSVIFLIFAWLGAAHLYQIINPEKETEEIAAASAAGAVCQTAGTAQSGDIPPMTDVPNSRNIESYVTRFFEAEAGRRTAMPDALAPGFVPFDIIILNVCSLSRDDIRYSHLENHPVFEKFDLAFEHFNGATSLFGSRLPQAPPCLLRAADGK